MKFVEIFTYPDLEWGILVCECLYVVCKCPVALVGKAGSEVSKDPIFSWGVLAAVILVRGRAGDGGARAQPGESWLLPCSVAVTSLSGCQQSSRCWTRSPEGQVQAGSFSSKCALPPLNTAPLSWWGAAQEQEKLDQALVADRSSCGKPARLSTLFSVCFLPLVT